MEVLCFSCSLFYGESSTLRPTSQELAAELPQHPSQAGQHGEDEENFEYIAIHALIMGLVGDGEKRFCGSLSCFPVFFGGGRGPIRGEFVDAKRCQWPQDGVAQD